MNLHIKNIIICVCLLLWIGSDRPAGAQAENLSASKVFQILPFQLLDSLPLALSDQERQRLVRYGISDNWHVLRSDRDLMEIHVQNDEVTPRLCLYRSELVVVAALGRDLGSLCFSGLWYINLNNLASPLAFPSQPRADEYFDLPDDLSGEIRASTSFCPQPEGLEARPLFWSSRGQENLTPEYSVFYYWNGRHFSKRAVDLRNLEARRQI